MRTPRWQWNSVGLAVVLAVFGLVAWAGAVAFPGTRPTLFVLYWTFLFAAALLRFLTPERRVRAVVSEHVYTDLAANEAALVEAYGLHDARIYVPVQDAEIRDAEGDSPVRLFVPRHAEYEVPADELQSLLVASDVEQRRGLSLLPSGGRLFGEFESMLGNDLSDSPGELATQLTDGITEGLELADRVTSDVRSAERRIDFGITDSVHGPVDRFDHPVQSFLAVGLAVGLDRPVVTETTTDSTEYDYTVTCHWFRDERSTTETT